MKKDIKEQLEKLQYYGEFYAKSDIDDKIKLEELDKTGEISEFGRNFSPQVDHKYTMVISDRRSYLLGNGRGGKDFTNFLTTLEKLDNEKYLGLRESLETDPARYHIYTHRGDLLEAFDGVYDEELNLIGNNFGEVYNDVNEAIKRGGVDLTDYPNLERAFDDYELKILDKEIWERDNNYVKFYMDNAYEYLNEKNVLLEEKRMLDAEKHKNVGADMKTVNDGSLLDGLSENVSIPEFEKVAGGLDKEAVDLSTKDFLKEPLDTFNEHSKSKKYNDILKDGRDSYLDVKDMLIEEGLIDKNRYDELLEEKAEFDKNEEIARKNIEKLMEDEAKEEYKLNEETGKRLADNNLKRLFNELTGEYTLYSTIPDKNGNEVELINYYDYDDSPAMIHHVMEDVEDFNNFKSQMDIVRMFKINDEFKDCKVNVSEIGYMESPLKVELDRGKLRNSKLTFLVDNDGDNVNLKTQINESYTTVLNMDALFDGKLSGRDLTNMNGFTRAKDNWEFTGELLFQMCDNNDMERNSEHYEFGYSDHLVKKDTFIKEEFEKACLSGEFIDKQFELFDEHSRNIKYFNTLSSAFFGDPTKVENFLVENHLIPEELVKDNEVSEQDFINAVKSVTNKEQDNTLEM